MGKREKIMEAAVSLFSRTHDIKKVSLEDIAAEAGVSPTTIYNNFGDRETLVYEIVKNFVSTMMEQSRAILRSDLPFHQKMISIVSAKMDLAGKAGNEILQKMVSRDKKIASYIDKLFETEVKPLWKEMLAEGKKQGYIDPDLDDEVLLVYIDVLKTGFQARPDLLRGFTQDMDFIEKLTRIAFYGFLKKDIDLFRKEEMHGEKLHHR